MDLKRTLSIAAALPCLAAASTLAGEEPNLEEKRDAKLQSEFLTKAPWIMHYGKARYDSRKSGKPIFAYFTRSYAECYWCDRTEKEALSDPAFPEFASDVVLFCHVTSKVEGDPYPDLFEEKGGPGFPYIVILDRWGRVIAQHQASRTVPEFRKTLEKAKAFQALEKKSRGGALEDRVDFLVAVIRNGDKARAAKLTARLPDLTANLQVKIHLATMQAANSARSHEEALAAGMKALEKAPDNPEALDGCARASYFLRKKEDAFRFAEKALRAKPDDGFLSYVIAEVMSERFVGPVALSAIRAGLKAYPENKELLKSQASLKARGADAYEQGPTATVAGLEVTPFIAAGGPPDPKGVREHRCYVFWKDGAFAHAMVHYEHRDSKTKAPLHRLWLQSLDDQAISLRRSGKAWSHEEALAIARKCAAGVPHVLAARRHNRAGLRPLEATSVEAGLALDPENETLLNMKKSLVAGGWDTFDAGEPEDVGGLRMRMYLPTGKNIDEKIGRRSRIVVLRDAQEKEIVRLYSVWTLPRLTSYSIDFREGPRRVAVARARKDWKDEAIPDIVRRTESALPDLRRALELIGNAPSGEKGTPKLIEAVGSCEAALRKQPEFVEAMQEMVRCYLFISDREPGTGLEAAAYERGMGAIDYLRRRDNSNWVASLAAGVFSYRFKAYPVASLFLNGIKKLPAARERCLEILGTMEAIGQHQYRSLGTTKLEGFVMMGFTRTAPPDVAPADGLRVIENCFVGYKDGGYRFHFLYREQKIGDAVERSLALARLHRNAVIRTFDARPTEKELKAEIQKALKKLQSGQGPTEPRKEP
ncbi:MAG: hypothetical protein ACYS9X_08665 [Planctomycetota bacterium]